MGFRGVNSSLDRAGFHRRMSGDGGFFHASAVAATKAGHICRHGGLGHHRPAGWRHGAAQLQLVSRRVPDAGGTPGYFLGCGRNRRAGPGHRGRFSPARCAFVAAGVVGVRDIFVRGVFQLDRQWPFHFAHGAGGGNFDCPAFGAKRSGKPPNIPARRDTVPRRQRRARLGGDAIGFSSRHRHPPERPVGLRKP